MQRKILVIDDQKDIREVYLQILTRQNQRNTGSLDSLENELFSNFDTPPEVENDSDKRMLEFEVQCASQGLEGVQMAQQALEAQEPYMLAFIDMRMPPGIDGKETAKRIREVDENIELVIVTAFSDHLCADIVEYIGSPSKLLFLKKPFDVEEIKQLAVNLSEKWLLNRQNQEYTENLERIVMERTKELVDKNRTLERLATMDILTELNNMQKFYEELDKEIERLRRIVEHREASGSLVLVMIDIDNLKYYNELFGHWNGDMIIKTIAEILKMTFRKSDIICRVGGDEFMVIIPQTKLLEAKRTCDRLISLIIGKFTFKDMVYLLDQYRIEEIKQISGYSENDIVQISITGGLVEFAGEQSPERLVSKASEALTSAKRKGKNHFVILEASQS